MKSFDVPVHYRSPIISAIKKQRKSADNLKKDFSPTVLRIGTVEIILARHFGFCYGVENAIEIAFRAVNDNLGKHVYLLSEMIHNPGVNADLQNLGVQFIMDTKGNQLIPWDCITKDDIVIIPAFGTTLEMESLLRAKGIEPTCYETTCPFVEKVWNRAEKIGDEGYSIIIHGKPNHEETKATFSHSKAHTKTLVINDMEEAIHLASFITQKLPTSHFYIDFKGQYSEGFIVENDLQKIGVVNQTTMLASETQAIADYLKQVMNDFFKPQHISERFADTRDTLCYATNDNQSAVAAMLEESADLAIVIGGYNSSNTSHLVELCDKKLPTYFIRDEACLAKNNIIRHFLLHEHKEVETFHYLSKKNPLRIMITSGASCPDALVERVIERLCMLTGNEEELSEWKEVGF